MGAIIPAVLGWKNPGDDGSQLRLYALDAGEGPRWSKDSETGRTLELAAQVDGNEGHRYLLVHVGDRYVDGDKLAVLTSQIQSLLEHTDLKGPGT